MSRNTTLKEQAMAWGFLAPALILLATFGLFPIGYAFFVSLHQWRLKKEAFVGFNQYVQAVGQPEGLGLVILGAALLWGGFHLRRWLQKRGWLSPYLAALGLILPGITALWLLASGVAQLLAGGDPRLYNGLKVTLFYALGTIPVEVGMAMGLAYLLFYSRHGKGFFRVVFFLPYVTPVIASAVVFRTLFSPHPSSLANRFWELLGLENQRWLYESRSVVTLLLQGFNITECPAWVDHLFPSLGLVSIILYNVWVYVGYDAVILLAGLSAIPQHYYEAARIDGASAWQAFRHITLPLISPALFFISIVSVIGTFKAFNHIYILRTPGARDTVDVLSITIFDQIFQYHNAGYASTLAFVLFIVILGLTVVQNRVIGKRVFYGE